jgi:hypothetical protein
MSRGVKPGNRDQRGLVNVEIHTGEDILECQLNVAGVESRSLDEGKMVLALK